MESSSSSGTYTGSDDKGWPERRRQALTSLELYKANLEALEACNMASCQMRYALVGDQISFLFRFEEGIPKGRLGFTFVGTWPENLINEGWKKFFLTIEVMREGQLFVTVRGRFERDEVPLDVSTEFLRTIHGGTGIGHDLITLTDTRNREIIEHTMEAVLNDKLKDGSPKYCRKADNLRDLSIEGYVAVLTRYAKHAALRRRVLPK